METIFITSDQTSLILIPQNETDRALLEKMENQGPLTFTKITQPVGILGQNVKDGIMITPSKPKKNDTTEA